jgi:hypothetical protein
MTTRAEAIEIFKKEPAAMRFLNTTPERLAAMCEAEFADCVRRGAIFMHESGELQMRAGKILEEYADLKSRPCLVNNLAHRAQRMRDLEHEFRHVRRVLREQYFFEP